MLDKALACDQNDKKVLEELNDYLDAIDMVTKGQKLLQSLPRETQTQLLKEIERKYGIPTNRVPHA